MSLFSFFKPSWHDRRGKQLSKQLKGGLRMEEGAWDTAEGIDRTLRHISPKKKTHQQMPIGFCLIFHFVPFLLTGCKSLRLVLLSLMRQRGEEMPHMCNDKVQHLTIITIHQGDRCISFKHSKWWPFGFITSMWKLWKNNTLMESVCQNFSFCSSAWTD